MTAAMNTDGSRESSDPRPPDKPLTHLDLDATFPDALADGVAEFLGKPRARGWIHVYSAFIAAVAGSALVAVSWSVESTRAGIATLIYTLTIVAMFAVSGTYHRVNWKSPAARKWMKRLDHSMIFIFIAGSYTPFALLALPSQKGMVLFWIVWGGALAGVLLKCFWPSAPRWVGVPLYILLGWVAAWFIGPIMDGAGVAAVVLLVMLQTSYLTPPMSPSIFYLRAIAPPSIRLQDMYWGVIPFILCQLVVLGLLLFFPALATWLPKVMYG